MRSFFSFLAVVISTAAVAAHSGLAASQSIVEPSWRTPPIAQVQQRLAGWLEQRDASDHLLGQVRDFWDSGGAERIERDRLDGIVEVIGLVDDRALPLMEACRAGATPETLAMADWLNGEQVAPLVRDHLRMLLARSLVQGSYYDEAIVRLEPLTLENILDPAALLFYRGVVYHHLADKEKGIAALDRLLENQQQLPQRYRVLGRLMREDLAQLKTGSLDDISRRMKDIRRQLGFGRVGEHVQQSEDEVIRMLDKLIEEEEKKRSENSQSIAGGAQSSRPAEDSFPLGGKGSGEVQKRKIGNSAGWGDLPPKEREQAMQAISRDFPAHYREVIEAYFRELAKENR
jgi:tetratricopeptide (TPR) repeat protein